jgi:hypothetical protein
MNRVINCLILFAMLLTACGQTKVKADVPDTTEGKATQIIVEQYINAIKTTNADLKVSLLNDDFIFLDHGLDDGPWAKDDFSYYVHEEMANPDSSKTQIDKYIVTPDGRFVVLQGTYSQAATTIGKWETAPAYAVLEFKNGKILNETWYYNGEVFH